MCWLDELVSTPSTVYAHVFIGVLVCVSASVLLTVAVSVSVFVSVCFSIYLSGYVFTLQRTDTKRLPCPGESLGARTLRGSVL